ncbi:hypothetical protein O3G_MSEX001690 [Manduca sexta]|uniref:Phosphatidylinositol-glycan biosynthesis class W protein n=1 Tax=Manduca sexta TaxID=7130 RepID=A0A921YKT0_MANSE|nr:hypothetical protein O3G_MSEX001690 [Manduca sexta]
MNSSEYKEYHESFMQNNHGSNASHVFFCIFFTVQCSVLASYKIRCISYRYAYEYLYIVLPLICAHTILSNYLNLLNIIVFLIVIYNIITTNLSIAKTKLNQLNKFKNNRIQSISLLRGLTYLITVFCILAVDFKDFPRYLAKTENYGYSLMDTGVGLFVLMSGLVHKELAKNKYTDIIKGNLKFVTILLFLGVARFCSIKQLDYQEHVTEYGVHWNFFFTLAICKILSTILLYFIECSNSLSFVVLFVHELFLYLGLQGWVFGDSPRDSLISANREGVCSCLGYVALYLFAAHLKTELTNVAVTRHVIIWKLIKSTIIMWVVSYIINEFRPASRTLANASYCLYLETVLLTMELILYFVEVTQAEETDFNVPLILQHINTNGLSYFLAANLLTGSVNLTIRTLLASNIVTFIILNTYMILTTAFVVYINKRGIKL